MHRVCIESALVSVLPPSSTVDKEDMKYFLEEAEKNNYISEYVKAVYKKVEEQKSLTD